MSSCLKTKNLCVSIADKIICHTLDLQINPGEIWGVLGPNGSGKTTLLHTLAGLRKPVSGQVMLQNKALSLYSKKSLACKLGILFQDTPIIFPQSVFDFCLTGRYPHLSYFKRERFEDLQIVNDCLDLLDLGSHTSKNIFNLSGGEKRRLAIATLLAQTPDIYFLDEPMNHLDLRYQAKVLNHFKKLAESYSATVMMAIHDVNLAQQYCSHILILFDNETIHGETEAILTAPNLTRLYQHPFRSTMLDNRKFWLFSTEGS